MKFVNSATYLIASATIVWDIPNHTLQHSVSATCHCWSGALLWVLLLVYSPYCRSLHSLPVKELPSRCWSPVWGGGGVWSCPGKKYCRTVSYWVAVQHTWLGLAEIHLVSVSGCNGGCWDCWCLLCCWGISAGGGLWYHPFCFIWLEYFMAQCEVCTEFYLCGLRVRVHYLSLINAQRLWTQGIWQALLPTA